MRRGATKRRAMCGMLNCRRVRNVRLPPLCATLAPLFIIGVSGRSPSWPHAHHDRAHPPTHTHSKLEEDKTRAFTLRRVCKHSSVISSRPTRERQ